MIVDGVMPAGLAVPEDPAAEVSVADAEADATEDADAVAIGATGETFLLTAESAAEEEEEDEVDDDIGAAVEDMGAADEAMDEADDEGPAATPGPIASGATDPPP